MTIHAHIKSDTAAAAPPEFCSNHQPVGPEPVEASSFSPGDGRGGEEDSTALRQAQPKRLGDSAESHFRAALSALETAHADAANGWTPQRQAQFLSAIADGATVADAAQEVGLSRRSAYALRRRAGGVAFDLGWQAADLLARDSLREDLWDRARNGQSWTTVRDDGEKVITTTRHRFDNRLALAMLTRLEARVADASHAMPVRLADKFDELLASIEQGEASADPAELLARLCPAAPDESAIGTCESCESTGGDQPDVPAVWFDPDDDTWMTRLAPPDAFAGQHYGFFLHDGYSRTLSAEEAACVAHFDPEDSLMPLPVEIAVKVAERAAWFTAASRASRIADVPALLAANEGRVEAAAQ